MQPHTGSKLPSKLKLSFVIITSVKLQLSSSFTIFNIFFCAVIKIYCVKTHGSNIRFFPFCFSVAVITRAYYPFAVAAIFKFNIYESVYAVFKSSI